MTVTSLLNKKLKFTSRCVSAGSGELTLTVSKAVAKKIGLKGTTLGSGEATCNANGRAITKIKPTAAATKGPGVLSRLGEGDGDAGAGRPDRDDHELTDDQPQGQGTRVMDWERDGITRRAALTRGFGGVALVCSFDFDKVTRDQRQEDVRVHAPVGLGPVRAVPARPADPAGRAAGRHRRPTERSSTPSR